MVYMNESWATHGDFNSTTDLQHISPLWASSVKTGLVYIWLRGM